MQFDGLTGHLEAGPLGTRAEGDRHTVGTQAETEVVGLGRQ